MALNLHPDDFGEFYAQVHAVPPFPWQADLAARVLAERRWPAVVDVPTGLGKTAMIDIAVFVAAATAGERGAERVGRRRVLFVVDRRIVVDEAHDRAQRLSRALDRALAAGEDAAATRRVALGLRTLAPDADRPLVIPAPVPAVPIVRSVLPVTRMRGGLTWDAAWLDRPDIAGIVVGTVDQVGSRLLFRGYGVSDRRKPIDAALVGTDSLVLVDEAHLAEVMVTTLADAQARDTSRLGVPPATIVQLTATPAATPGSVYAFDVGSHRANRVAWRRLAAAKTMSLVAAEKNKTVDALAQAAVRPIAHGVDTVLVVCNTVMRARQVHSALVKMATGKRDRLDADVSLLIGRSRPADRDLLVGETLARFGVGRSRTPARTAILVATQTVEVGANLDVDALVSESAPWDALVQRLGRLNRLGDHPGIATATIVHDTTEDLVYGPARTAAWAHVSGLVEAAGGVIDVSPLACRALNRAVPPDAVAARPGAPLLLAPVLDAWARTGPVPDPDAPVAPYLHGLGRHPATVAVAWRDGLVDADPAGGDAERPDHDIDADLAALPVLAAETVEVPIHAAKAWLRGEPPLTVSDLDDSDEPGGAQPRAEREPFRALAWRSVTHRPGRGDAPVSPSSGAWRWVDASDIRPGDTLVVPVERGGLDRYGWAPGSTEVALDVAEAIRFTPGGPAPRRARLRVDDRTGWRLGLDPDDCRELRRRTRLLSADNHDDDPDSSETEPVTEWLRNALGRVVNQHAGRADNERLPGSAWTPGGLRALQAWVGAGVEVSPLAEPRVGADSDGVIGPEAGADRFIMTRRSGPATVERDDELVECSSMGTRPVSLRAHHANVGDRAMRIAQALGLPREVVAAVEAAARWHDLGKTDPRFQAMLCGGDRYEAMLLDEPLAKSGLDPNNRPAYRRARIRSRLPVGARHEAWSATIVRQHLSTAGTITDIDADLVVHLVASHHGHARPWLPPVIDDEPTEITTLVEDGRPGGADTKATISSAQTVDLDHPSRFAALNARYGRWGLALLETIVRCADMTVSEEGS